MLTFTKHLWKGNATLWAHRFPPGLMRSFRCTVELTCVLLLFISCFFVLCFVLAFFVCVHVLCFCFFLYALFSNVERDYVTNTLVCMLSTRSLNP